MKSQAGKTKSATEKVDVAVKSKAAVKTTVKTGAKTSALAKTKPDKAEKVEKLVKA